MSRTALLGTIILAFMATSAEAATRVWVGGQASNLWTNAANWQGNVAPVNGDRAVFSVPGAASVSFNDFPALQLDALEISSDADYLFKGNPIAVFADTGLVIHSSSPSIKFEARFAMQSRNPRMQIGAGASGVSPIVNFGEVLVRGSLVVTAPGATLNFSSGVVPLLTPAGLDITAETVRFDGENTYDLDVNITVRRFIAPGEALTRVKSVTYVRPGSGLLEFTSPRPSEEQRYDLRGTAPGSGLRTFDPVINEIYVDGIQIIEAAQDLSLPGLLWGPGRIAITGGHKVTILGKDNLFTGGLEVRDGVLAFGRANAIPPVNDLALNGPKAVLQVGAFPIRVRNFSCNNGAVIDWTPSANPIEITGSIDIAGCILSMGDTSGAPGPTVQEVTLLQNNPGTPIVGQFDGAPEGLRFMLGGIERFVTYTGGGAHGDVAFTSAFNLGRVEGSGPASVSVPVGGSVDLHFSARILDAMKNPRPGVAARATISPAGCGRFSNGAETMGLVADAQAMVVAPTFTGVAYNRTCSVTLAPVSGGGAAAMTVVVYEPASLRLTFLSDYALASSTAVANYDVFAAAGGIFGVFVPQLPVTAMTQSTGPAMATATMLAPTTGAFGFSTVRLTPNGVAGPYDLVAQTTGASRTLHITQLASITGRTRTSTSGSIINAVTLMDGGAGCTLDSVDFNAPAPAGPAPGWLFPRGFVRIAAHGCAPGTRLHFYSYDTARPRNPDGAYLRYGPAANDSEARWRVLPEPTFDANKPFGFTFTLVDGATEDVVSPDGTLTATVAYAVPVTYQDMWWAGSVENGWGLSVVQHRDTLFAVIYAYDNAGKPIWYVMPGGSWNKQHTAYSGSLYLPHGTPFYAYNASALVPGSSVGTATVTVIDGDHAVLSYTINGTSGSKSITRQSFGDPKGYEPVHGDMWWGGTAQNGWGIASMAQGAKLFSIWFTYDAAGAPTWFVMPDGGFSDGRRRYSGKLYRTMGSAWLGQNYNASQLQVIETGTFSFDFSGETARFQYSNEGHTGTLQLERQPF